MEPFPDAAGRKVKCDPVTCEAIRFAHRRQEAADRPATAWSDLGTLAALGALLPVACLCPPRWWSAVGRVGAALAGTSGNVRPGSALRAISDASLHGPATPRAIAAGLAANRVEQRLQVLRELTPWHWHPSVVMHGVGHLADGLAAQRGIVLWVSHFVFAGTVAKIALRRAGYDVVHLSRPEHGFSKTRLGIAMINPLRRHAEDRHLAGRVEVERGRAASAVRRLRTELASNRIVSLTVGDWEGNRVAHVPCLGGWLPVATGAPKLALLAGAMLLPVHVVRRADGQTFDLMIGAPLLPRTGEDRVDALRAAIAGYARSLEPMVRRAPDQWRGWAALARTS